MKYGKLFKEFINAFGFYPIANKCSALPYSDLKLMAKYMYGDVVDVCADEDIPNPLEAYMRQSKELLSRNVYTALRILFA